MFKLEFPADNKALAAAIGRALVEYSGGAVAPAAGREVQADTREELKTAIEDAAALTLDEPTLDEAAVSELAKLEAAGTTVRLDHNGVVFDKDYCANATDPFYKTGKTAGQWKKKKGVDQDEYDDWYASVKPERGTAEDKPAEDFDTSQAFNKQQASTAGTAPPATAGEFMVWVSEMQTAQHFTQADVTQAYATAGIGAPDIFQGANAVQNIASLHGILSAMVPA